MKRTVIMMLSLVIATALCAQTDSLQTKKKKERKVELTGEVYDSFTKAKVKALITLMKKEECRLYHQSLCRRI